MRGTVAQTADEVSVDLRWGVVSTSLAEEKAVHGKGLEARAADVARSIDGAVLPQADLEETINLMIEEGRDHMAVATETARLSVSFFAPTCLVPSTIRGDGKFIRSTCGWTAKHIWRAMMGLAFLACLVSA